MLRSLYRFLSPKFQTVFLDYKVEPKPRYGHGKPPHALLYDIINAHRLEYAVILKKMLDYTDVFTKIPLTTTDPHAPMWHNSFLPALDIVGIYTMLNIYNPQKYIEVGSGNSTKVAYKAIKENNLRTRITSVDPYPRAEIDALSDEIIRQPLEDVGLWTLDIGKTISNVQIPNSNALNLEAGDILFIDNSHRVLPNSDAMVFFMEILPQLKPGVVVHIHDIYLPYDYPQFMCDRFYSEQYTLAAFILADPKRYKPILPNYFISEDKELHDILTPIWSHPNLKNIEKHGGSFWMLIGK